MDLDNYNLSTAVLLLQSSWKKVEEMSQPYMSESKELMLGYHDATTNRGYCNPFDLGTPGSKNYARGFDDGKLSLLPKKDPEPARRAAVACSVEWAKFCHHKASLDCADREAFNAGWEAAINFKEMT